MTALLGDACEELKMNNTLSMKANIKQNCKLLTQDRHLDLLDS